MTHLAQFAHDPVRLDLGGTDRVLTVWQCEDRPGMCDNWAWGAGANAATVTVLDAARGLVEPPTPDTTVHPEAVVRSWTELGDADGGGDWQTRIGGLADWIQSPDDAPPPPWRFVAQLAESVTLTTSPPSADEVGLGVQSSRPGDTELSSPGGAPGPVEGWVHVDAAGWTLPGPNFGGGGIAYVFLDRSVDPPAAGILWQC